VRAEKLSIWHEALKGIRNVISHILVIAESASIGNIFVEKAVCRFLVSILYLFHVGTGEHSLVLLMDLARV